MAGIGNRYSNNFRDCIFRYFPRGLGEGDNPREVGIPLHDVQEFNVTLSMQTEGAATTGAKPAYIARGMQEYTGSMTVLGYTYREMRRAMGIRPNENVLDYNHADQMLWVYKRQTPGQTTEPASTQRYTGVIFNDFNENKSSSGTGIIQYVLQFRFACPIETTLPTVIQIVEDSQIEAFSA